MSSLSMFCLVLQLVKWLLYHGQRRSLCSWPEQYLCRWITYLFILEGGKKMTPFNMYTIFIFIFSSVTHCNFLKTSFPFQATFFTTYVLTSGWASLSSELMQLFGLTWNFIRRYILRMEEDDLLYSFPYHTEVPKVLLFGLLGFTFSVLAPLILPFLLLYFCLGYVVYRNQVRN